VVKQLPSPAFLTAVGVLALLLLAQTRVTDWQETLDRYLGQR
jgi:hypothetical protein